MLAVLAPAKTLDFGAPPPALAALASTTPRFAEDARVLAAALAALDEKKLARVLEISAPSAREVRAAMARFDPASGAPAALTFAGEVFRGLGARTLGAADLAWGQDRVVILSALYGVLRLLDRIGPHRLEIGARLATPRGHNLYTFWSDLVTTALGELLAGHRDRTLVDLSSQEHAKLIWPRSLDARIVRCVFESWKDAARTPNVIPTHSRHARGAMARFAIEARVERAEELQRFDRDGYRFVPERSSAEAWIFGRPFAG